MNITFIGAGNVAWHLAQALHAAGHTITAIYSRNAAQRDALAGKVAAAAIVSLDLREEVAEVVLIAVPDAALAAVAAEIKVKSGTVVAHTSGSQPLAILAAVAGAKAGVFYPLQTFSKAKAVDFAQVPLLLEAKDAEALESLQALAQSISKTVETVDSEARKQLHLAAVFACNFTNHLLGISQQLLEQAGLPIALLRPLLQETIAKAMQQHPFTVQTGPAIRHDDNVIQAHLHMLQQQPRWQDLYRLLTQSIQDSGNQA
ncbi:Rossmann-like and DUF2520 domain-containing protein [Pontibacter akesuensis]|uniref:Predicted oxidoreductase, contains short-chain dehydrogenase (SDR) and DUF2520 domains n=1 Tax=Pontibacter akesuensis TaxID=388950 RepID=A0A1I7JMM5_9BACT|nr:Rossmann-like and DUF2520 domain-containing protein [Pontibacter akesuensis]GHA68894.1 hypothetical protein GCM10007389_22400 [Pontibacter akesuensis]SFU86397.1 Predicted oxidoreductase, contains short-chain dehydrogenase (SDR) and DUF2520 domains [Pontibacter akesuensis]